MNLACGLSEVDLDDFPLAIIIGPFHHDDLEIQEGRRGIALSTAAMLSAKNPHTGFFSPITHHRAILEAGGCKDETYWNKLTLKMLQSALSLYVIQITGWKNDSFVMDCILYAEENDIAVFPVTVQYEEDTKPDSIIDHTRTLQAGEQE